MTNEKKVTSDILLDEDVSNVKYGKKEYNLKKIKLKQLLLIIKIISKQSALIQKAFKENASNNTESTQLDDIILLIEILEEDQIYELMSILLQIDKKTAEDDFSISGCINVLFEVMKQEDIKQIFFQIGQMTSLLNNTTEKINHA